MSFIKKLLGGVWTKTEKEELTVLEEGICLLRLSTFHCLQKTYLPRMGLDKANAIAIAVVSTMILDSPSDDRFRQFYQKNKQDIYAEAANAHQDKQISGPSGCASYLYAAEILRLSLIMASSGGDASPLSKTPEALLQQAVRLRIEVPTRQDICGSSDQVECVRAIHSFAKAFYYTNTWTGATPSVTGEELPSLQFDSEFVKRILHDLSDPVAGAAAAPEEGSQRQSAPGYQVALEAE